LSPGRRARLPRPLLGEAAVWESATPFVATAIPSFAAQTRSPEDYASSQAFAGHVLRQELDRLRERRPDLPATLAIEPLEFVGGRLRPIQFRRGRQAGRRRRPPAERRVSHSVRPAGARPLCLGHACHFGLGLFLPRRRAKNGQPFVAFWPASGEMVK